MKRKSFVLVSLVMAVVLIGVAVLPIVRAQESLIPAPTGPYQIGTITRYWVDDSREETLTPEDDDKRELVVQFWYPAEVGAGENTADYISHPEVVLPTLDSELSGAGINITIASEDFVGSQSHAFEDAPLAENEETYPVLIFSPGWSGTPQIYTTQLEELASHGYIVAGINRPYISTATFLPDGRTATPVVSSALIVSAIATEDEIFVLDQLEILNTDDPEDFFTGRLDLDRIGLFGHSLGGGASVQTCRQDSRCKAGADVDGDVFGDAFIEGFDQPFMFLSNEHGASIVVLPFRAARGPAYALRVIGTTHLSFSDLPLWPDPTLTAAGWRGKIEPEHSLEIIRTYLLAFFDTYLKGQASDLLERASDDYPEVDIKMKNT